MYSFIESIQTCLPRDIGKLGLHRTKKIYVTSLLFSVLIIKAIEDMVSTLTVLFIVCTVHTRP